MSRRAPTALRRRLNLTIVAALACAVIVLLADKYLFHGIPHRVEAAQAGAAPTATRRPDVLPNSIAVLPCTNQSPKAEDAYFAAGIHEEIILRLAKLKNLSPIPRLAMLQYANSALTPAQIAAELRAHAIVDCTVRYANDRVRITAELIDPSSMRVLWSDAYEQEWDRVFAIQADIAMKVANAIGAEFSPAEQAQIERPPTKSAEAYRLYLQSRDLIAIQSPEAIRQGVLLLDRALELDPDFAQARIAKLGTPVFRLVDTTEGATESACVPSSSRSCVPSSSARRRARSDYRGVHMHSAHSLRTRGDGKRRRALPCLREALARTSRRRVRAADRLHRACRRGDSLH